MPELLGRVATTLVTGASPVAREAAIAGLLEAQPAAPDRFNAVILEGLASGSSSIPTDSSVRLVRLAAGCVCCTGNLVLRVTLNRLLRQGPERLFIGVASSEHLDQLRSWLQEAPYDQLLALNPTVCA
ncbi:GTP-binding protein [Massilia sp. IC2-476]|uniref:GTP-binding protein n=1 Tax=Massilia sp. IC2-476 TaxID=2887199 RepID=UPI001D12084B|nr:GTP-binding protein [Massilia sp. IC2-476]MCC2971310.1 GTPase [Massilia sp. IC2-476]